MYRMAGIEPGSYTLHVTNMNGLGMNAFGEAVFDLEIPDIARFEYDIELPMGTLSGLVRDRATYTPLGTVRIVLQRTDKKKDSAYDPYGMGNRVAEIYSNEKGRFRISNLAPGTYSLRAGGGNALGMNMGGYGVTYLNNIRLSKDEQKDEILLELEKGGNLKGRVIDPLGNPVAGASLYIRGAGEESFESFSDCTTDGTGLYQYLGLAPGKCFIRVEHGDFPDAVFSAWIDADKTTVMDLKLGK
jgi:hypothetical protein